MLELILGRNRAKNTEAVLDRIAAAVARREGGQILIVPEQFSHDAERQLCARCGDTVSLYAEVLSFTRLADRVFSVCGGVCREALDDGGRFTALALALEQVQPRLKVYASARGKPELIVRLADQLAEFKNYGVSGGALRAAAARFEGAFAQKLEELGLILESYDAVCAAGKADPAGKLDRLCELLWESDYIADKNVYLDGFTDFTGLQVSILDTVLRRGRPLTVTLAADGARGGAPVYDAAREAAGQLLRLAGPGGAQVTQLPEDCGGMTALLRDQLFSGRPVRETAAGDVTIRRAASPDDECTAAVQELRRLLMAGYRCRDIVVACTDRGRYVPLLRPLLRRCGIPAYFTGRESILEEPALRAVLSALRSAAGGMEAEDVFSFLRSPLGPLDRDAVDRLEVYVRTWRIGGSRWQQTWTMHPDGYGAPMDDAARERLAALNEWRLAASEPLLRLRAGLTGAADTEGQTWALYAFLQEIGAEERLKRLSKDRALSDQRAQELGQLYEICLSAMEQLALVLGRTTRTPEDFTATLRQLLGQYSLGTIPARLDGVTVGEPASLRYRHPKALLVLGAEDGMLPKLTADGGILTDQERGLLQREAELTLAPDRTGRMDRELATVCDLLCSGAERIYVSYCGETPSYLVQRLGRLFPGAETASAALPLLVDSRTAGGYLAACAGDSPLAGRLRSLDRPELNEAERQVRARADYRLGSLSEAAVETLYHRSIPLSASRIDLFSACRCAYFLRYGLGAQEQKEADVDAPVFGTFVHAVLEHTAREVQAEGGFAAVTPARLREIAEEGIRRFTAEELRDLDAQGPRARYLYERNLREIRDVADNLGEELRRSRFVPVAYELDFVPGGTLPPVEIETARGRASVVGFVDRVDCYHAPEADYYRVVDYKTGKKSFSYADVQNGMGMQLLIYLFALEGAGQGDRPLRPAGVLYFPARVPFLTAAERPDAEEAAALRRKEERRSGLLLRDERMLRAMEDFEDQPEFLPCALGKDGQLTGDLAAPEQLRLLRRHVRRTLEAITDAILAGDVHPNPYFRGKDRSACRFCGFAAICHRDTCGPELRYFAEQKPEEFWKRLEEEDHG